MKYPYKTWDHIYTFCIVLEPPLEGRCDSEVLIVSQNSGSITQKSVDSTWLMDEERLQVTQNPINTLTSVQINQNQKLFSLETLSMT